MLFFRKIYCHECDEPSYYGMRLGNAMLCEKCLRRAAAILNRLGKAHGSGVSFMGDETTGYQIPVVIRYLKRIPPPDQVI